MSEENAEDPKKINFMRAARTDKGVHALGQAVSVNLIMTDTMIEDLNRHLPEQMRVWDIVRTTKSFHSKNACDSRMYEYLMPTYVLADAPASRYPRSKLAAEQGVDVTARHVDFSLLTQEEIRARFKIEEETLDVTPEEIETNRAFRVTPEKLKHLVDILKAYKGTNNFHNFTIGQKFEQPNSKRYILDFTCSEPFVREGLEWVSLRVHGQSFMLHQIRKMVGLAIMMVCLLWYDLRNLSLNRSEPRHRSISLSKHSKTSR